MTACAPLQDTIAEIRAHRQLEQYRENLASGFFETVIRQSKEVVAESETDPPAEVAFYVLGEVYSHHDYGGRDYNLSQYYFEKLIENFPESELSSEAKTYISLLNTIAAKEKAVAEADKKIELAVRSDGKTEPKTQSSVEERKSSAVTEPRKVVEDKNFAEAVKRNLEILEEVGRKKPADEALYNLGLIYAHVDNPAKDYKKSEIYFHVLTKQFPESEYAEEARIWLGLFETIDKIQQIDLEIEQQKKQLTR
jgi:TolA-binding protein